MNHYMGARKHQIKWAFIFTKLRGSKILLGQNNGLNYFMRAREDQIKRLFSITKLRDELFYGGERAPN